MATAAGSRQQPTSLGVDMGQPMRLYVCSSDECATEFEGRPQGGAIRYCPACKKLRAAAASRRCAAANPEKARANAKAWRDANIDRARANSLKWMSAARAADPELARLKRKAWMYSTTPAWIRSKHEEQGGLCGICPNEVTVTSAHIDHDHACCDTTQTQRKACGRCNRDLLCGRCNAMLGFAGDDPVLMLAAVDYLRAHART